MWINDANQKHMKKLIKYITLHLTSISEMSTNAISIELISNEYNKRTHQEEFRIAYRKQSWQKKSNRKLRKYVKKTVKHYSKQIIQ